MEHVHLLCQVQVEDPMQLRNFLRLYAVEIEELVGSIGPGVPVEDFPMRAFPTCLESRSAQ
jgi:hypothetical protein